jgi:hypothetical protein
MVDTGCTEDIRTNFVNQRGGGEGGEQSDAIGFSFYRLRK